jgi:hypothetical protein
MQTYSAKSQLQPEYVPTTSHLPVKWSLSVNFTTYFNVLKCSQNKHSLDVGANE